MLHQTVIGLETLEQLEMAGDYPDVVIGCVGGGSNFSGMALPFARNKIVDGKETRIVAVEPTACPTMTKGLYRYDFGDTAMTTPLIKMYTLGHDFIPAPIHAGGLRYHGMASIVCHLYELGLIEAVAVTQNPVFASAVSFARAEGFIPAPETAHAIKVAMDEALLCKETGEEKTIVFNYSGHGLVDMAAYDAYFNDSLEDYALPQEEIDKYLAGIPDLGL
jgi:tryptophan synthase beta chain